MPHGAAHFYNLYTRMDDLLNLDRREARAHFLIKIRQHIQRGGLAGFPEVRPPARAPGTYRSLQSGMPPVRCRPRAQMDAVGGVSTREIAGAAGSGAV